MRRDHTAGFIAAIVCLTSLFGPSVRGAGTAKPNDTEATFIAGIQQKMLEKYPTASSAVRGGYFAMTGIGDDNTAVYFNGRFVGVDANHPNFLWYDRHGKLVGLDYEYPVRSSPRPPGRKVFPVLQSRWTVVDAHAHFAYRVGHGPLQMHGARVRPNLVAPAITASDLRADKLLPRGATLAWAYYHPKCWDLGFWLVPNPNGAFAERNPVVR